MAYPYFEEHEDSPTESVNRSGEFVMQRIFLTAWDDRWQFIRHHFRAGFNGLPASYSADWPGVFADTASTSRIVNAPESQSITDPNTQQLTHDTLAKITVSYSPLSTDEIERADPTSSDPLPGGTWATYSQDSNVEFREIPSRAMAWESDGEILPPDVQQVVPQAMTTHEVSWNQLTFVPWVSLGNMKGCVNATACRLPGSPQVFQPETLLFEGLSDETTISLELQTGTRKLRLRFSEMSQKNLTATADGASGATVYGWNHQWREESASYDRIVVARGTDPLFKTYEFNDIWGATE